MLKQFGLAVRETEETTSHASVYGCEQRRHRRHGRITVPELHRPRILMRQSELDLVRLAVPGQAHALVGDREDHDGRTARNLVLVVWELRVVRQPPERRDRLDGVKDHEFDALGEAGRW
jgi:hypothetical protein